MRQVWVALATICIVAVTVCSGNAKEPVTAETVIEREVVETVDTEDQQLAELAIAVLAKELGVPKDTIRVDTVCPVDWRDSSIGCPQPNEFYLQVITPGHKITLKVGEQLYVVHEANGRAFVCERNKTVGGGHD